MCLSAVEATAAPAGRRPATRPAARADVDRSTPRAGLAALLAANEARDRHTAEACFHASTRPEKRFAESLALLGTAQSQLRRAVHIRFGEPAARELCGHIILAADVAKMRVEDHGGTAVVHASAAAAFPMVKVDGKWLVSVSAMAANEKHDGLLLALGYVDYALRHSLAAKGVMEGRYRSLDAIREYLETGKPIEEAAARE
jgi:hypothetical protein